MTRHNTPRTAAGFSKCLNVILAVISLICVAGCLEENEECVEHVGWGTEGKYYYYTGECTAVSPAPQGAEQAAPIYEFSIHFEDSFLEHFSRE